MPSVINEIDGTYESVQSVRTNAQPLPNEAVLLPILKAVESELRRRGMLGTDLSNVTPLWFLAETERNVFLWRQGKSLDHQKEFDFWVDCRALIEKRRSQLKNPNGLNPFINPLWGCAPLDSAGLDRACDYLDDFEDLSGRILSHAVALSHASRTIRHELLPESKSQQAVMLPVDPLRKS